MKTTSLALALQFTACLPGCFYTTETIETCDTECENVPNQDACLAECGTCVDQCKKFRSYPWKQAAQTPQNRRQFHPSYYPNDSSNVWWFEIFLLQKPCLQSLPLC